MKKIILIAFLFVTLISTTSEAQIALKNTSGEVTDTVTNTGSGLVYTAVRGYQSTVTIQADIEKVSGTLGGYVIPVVSNDGVTFYPIPVTNTLTDSAKVVANVANQGFVFTMPKGYLYYGLRFTGTGTMVGVVKGSCLYRKQ